ncbi:MAG: ABC transporter permease subunit [Candidatus Dormibacteria bacterium]
MLLSTFSIHGFEFPLPILFLGLTTGLTYGLLAVGLVLVYRATRIINFAHGQIGAFGAAILGLVVLNYHVPYWLFFPFAVLLSAGIGAGVEFTVIRRLRNTPRLLVVIGTLGVSQVLLAVALLINAQAGAGVTFPQPPGIPTFHIGAYLVNASYSAMLILTVPMIAALLAFLRFSRYGMAIRAAASNPENARLMGISAARMSSLSWAIAGAVAGFTAILIFPTSGVVGGAAFGPSLLLRALAAGVVARMNNIPVAVAAGIAVGETEQLLLWNNPYGGTVEAVLFGIILVALLLQPSQGGRREEKGSWAAVQGWRPIPDVYQRAWLVRHLGVITAVFLFVVAMVVPSLITFGAAFSLTVLLVFAIVGLSLGVITGLAGELSLGQFGFAAVGAIGAYFVSHSTGNYILGVFGGGALAAAASLLVGIPAIRIRGLMLAVTTLSFAIMAQSWLLQQPWTLGAGVTAGRPDLFGRSLTDSKEYYYFALAFFALTLWLAGNIRRGGLGRIFVALRDNEQAARAFTVSATGRKLQAFGLSGFMAGLGGGVFAYLLAKVTGQAFGADQSINTVAMAVIGGIGVLFGPILGALYIKGVPEFLPLDAAGLAATSFGWLLLILYFPGGLASTINPVRDRVVKGLARLSGVTDTPDETVEGPGGELSKRPASMLAPRQGNGVPAGDRADSPILEVVEVSRRFGGVQAVDGISLTVAAGETLGLIGPNGAGKTTLFELISGFTKPDSGTIRFGGHMLSQPVTLVPGVFSFQYSASPHISGRRGLVRSFQDAGLFPTMTVLEVLMLAQEKVSPTTLFASLVGSRELERPKLARARELVETMGLTAYAHKQIRELSTGTRRIVELGAMIALEPTLLLLDEPSSGIAQRETEALLGVLQEVKRHLDATLIVIEHDIPLIMNLADRIIAMESGKIIATGTPAEIRQNAQVIESYLGGDLVTIERSGPQPVAAPA